MSATASPRSILDHARARLVRSAIRRQLRAIAAGKSDTLSFDLNEPGVDVIGLVLQVTSRLHCDSAPMTRLVSAFTRSGVTDAAVDGLASRHAAVRVGSARLLGALRHEPAVPLLAPLLSSPDDVVADASARALGRIGGVRAADSLLLAIQRTGTRRTLVIELARAAPDLFLEAALSGSRRSGAHAAIALAAGLRRRQVSVRPLLSLLVGGTRRQRVISCRALGWIGARSAVPLIEAALEDREWRVRVSAAKALAALHKPLTRHQVDALLADRHHGVVMQGLKRLGGTGVAHEE